MLVKSVYDVLTFYLGETDRRGFKKLPDEHERLKDAITKLVVNAYRYGTIVGKGDLVETVKSQAKDLDTKVAQELFKIQREIRDNKPKLDDKVVKDNS